MSVVVDDVVALRGNGPAFNSCDSIASFRGAIPSRRSCRLWEKGDNDVVAKYGPIICRGIAYKLHN
jgi:hypothetical protein